MATPAHRKGGGAEMWYCACLGEESIFKLSSQNESVRRVNNLTPARRSLWLAAAKTDVAYFVWGKPGWETLACYVAQLFSLKTQRSLSCNMSQCLLVNDDVISNIIIPLVSCYRFFRILAFPLSSLDHHILSCFEAY